MKIWEDDSGRALVSEEQLKLIEDSVGQAFPAGYMDVIRTRNAAYFERQEFPVVTPEGPEDKSVAVLLNADGDESDAESMLSQWRTLQDEHEIGPHIVPFGMDGGGNLVCFDFSAPSEPAIVYWQHDETWAPIQVAGSFKEFLQQLS